MAMGRAELRADAGQEAGGADTSGATPSAFSATSFSEAVADRRAATHGAHVSTRSSQRPRLYPRLCSHRGALAAAAMEISPVSFPESHFRAAAIAEKFALPCGVMPR